MRRGFLRTGPPRPQAEASLPAAAAAAAAAAPPFPDPSSLGPALRFLYCPSADGFNENLLLLLHGRGDSAAPFARFASALHLPQTATLALDGTLELAHCSGGRGWWLAYDEDGEELAPDHPEVLSSRRHSLAALEAALDALSVAGWPRHRVHLFGFSDGGSVRPQRPAARA
jgi:predicted esterase